jgi:hypothetical protein
MGTASGPSNNSHSLSLSLSLSLSNSGLGMESRFVDIFGTLCRVNWDPRGRVRPESPVLLGDAQLLLRVSLPLLPLLPRRTLILAQAGDPHVGMRTARARSCRPHTWRAAPAGNCGARTPGIPAAPAASRPPAAAPGGQGVGTPRGREATGDVHSLKDRLALRLDMAALPCCPGGSPLDLACGPDKSEDWDTNLGSCGFVAAADLGDLPSPVWPPRPPPNRGQLGELPEAFLLNVPVPGRGHL